MEHLDTNVPWTLWTFTGIRGVDLSPEQDFRLAEELAILPTSPLILSRWSNQDLNLRQKRDMENVGHYLVYKSRTLFRDRHNEDEARNRLLNALMAIQIVKPSPTLGYVLQVIEMESADYSVFGPAELRAPVDPGQWPTLRHFDAMLLEQAVGMIARVDAVMAGGDARKKNAIHLFQLALEHHHPGIACLLAVASMEACLDTWNASGFEKGLCDLLGNYTPAFPDWNSPEFSQPPYTVGELAFNLHRLRSTIAHGSDLLEATGKGGQRIDFRNLRDFIEEQQRPTYIQLLCESSICLACQILQKSV